MNDDTPTSVDDARRALLALLPALAFADMAVAQDAAKVQPTSYKVTAENERGRVLDFHSRPGMGVCGTGMHSHPAHLTICLSPAKVRVKLPNGQQLEVENQIGDVFFSEAETHEVENISGKDVRALIVELKTPKG